MKKMILWMVLICFAFSVNLYGQIEVKATKTILAKKQLSTLDEFFENYSIFTINDVERFFPAEGEAKVLMKLGNEFQWNLDLEDNNSLFAADYKATMMTENGEIELPKPDIKLFKSKDPDNTTRISVYDGMISGVIEKNGERYVITPLSTFIEEDKSNRLVLYNEKDVKRDAREYITTPIEEDLKNKLQARAIGDFTNTERIIKIGLHADFPYYERYRVGDNDKKRMESISNKMAGEIHQCEGVFESTFNIKFQITHSGAFAEEKEDKFFKLPDLMPGDYSPDDKICEDYLLDKFTDFIFSVQRYWVGTNAQGPRNIMIIFSARKFVDCRGNAGVGGMAQPTGMQCNGGKNYVFVTDHATQTANNLMHEIGHSLGAHHSNDDYIMGSGRYPSFSPYSINEIKSHMSGLGDCIEKKDLQVKPDIHYISGYTAFGPGSQGDYTAYPSYDNNPDITYEWRVNGGLISRSNNSSIMSYIFNRAGTYTITCKATNTKGNISGSQASLSVQVINGMNVQSITLPTDFFQIVMPNENELIVSKASGEKEYIQNMNSDKISYQVNNALTGVLATLGTVVNGGSINTSNIPKGIYVITLTSTDGHTESHKISIQ